MDEMDLKEILRKYALSKFVHSVHIRPFRPFRPFFTEFTPPFLS
jgi:hypothetical protein